MSQYIILVKTVNFGLTANLELNPPLYALTTTHHPLTGFTILQNCSPVKLELVHTIRTANRTDAVEQTLQMKFRSRLSHSFWYSLTPEDVAQITALNENNFQSMIGLIQKSMVKPSMTEAETRALVEEALSRAQAALQ